MTFLKIKERRGFTLAELMAVVVIVAIIAGIGFGSYRKAVERAKFADGLAGAHALAAAYDAYYYDHNYTYPTAASQLDVSLSGSTMSGLKVTTKNFVFTVGAGGVVSAERVNENYKIQVPLETVSAAGADKCVGTDAAGDGQAFCASMGYSCGSSDNEKC